MITLRGFFRPLRRLFVPLIALLASSAVLKTEARASVSIFLEQPYGKLTVAWNPTGHSALYFDHICAASPVELRPCEPGELGVVISRYESIGTYDWVAVPLVPYLYAVETVGEIPSSADRLDVVRMRDLYRREHLESVAPDTATGGMPEGTWYELVGSAYDRSIYGFRVNTTAEQDASMIALFNDRPNVRQYSGTRRNCADFVRVTIDRLYPHAIRRNYIADFGVSTPKSAARGLAHYGRKHPEAGLEEFRIAQVPGNLPRSGGVEGVTEAFVKHYGVPLTLISPHITAAVLLAYVGQGRFAVPKNAPTLNLGALQAAAVGSAGVAEVVPAADDVELPAPKKGLGGSAAGADAAVPTMSDGSAAGFGIWTDCKECVEFDYIP